MVSSPGNSGITALLRGMRGGRAPLPRRPAGRLLWLHLPAGLPGDALDELTHALEDIHILCTGAGVALQDVLCQPAPGPRKTHIDQFLAHWQPDILLWGRAENGLAVVRRAKRAGVKMLMADLAGQGLAAGMRGRQLTEFLQYFEKILLADDAEQERLAKHGLGEAQLTLCQPLSEIAAALPENEALQRRYAGALGARPVWCAAMVSRGEVGTLLAAHRQAVRSFPNLLLVVVPRAAPEVMARQIREDGWRLAQASPETLPDRQAEVLLAQNADDLPTWMRLATVSYMGGTLFGPEAADPFDAVALGSAVLSGPMQAPFEHRYQRLIHAGALALAETNAVLAAKLVEALAPELSAKLALAAWHVGSEGARAVQILAGEIMAQFEEGS